MKRTIKKKHAPKSRSRKALKDYLSVLSRPIPSDPDEASRLLNEARMARLMFVRQHERLTYAYAKRDKELRASMTQLQIYMSKCAATIAKTDTGKSA